jgi:iron(III) transport system substrate-binding protein
VNEKVFPDKSLWPKKWGDYLNPPAAWKDKLALFDPRSSSAGYNVAYSLYKRFGEEKWRKIYANVRDLNPGIYTGSTGGIQACVTGEKPVMFYMMNNHIARVMKKGAPLPIIVPEDGTMYIVVNLGVIKNAPHPNAARLMADFLLDPEGGQKVYTEKLNQYALHPSVQAPKGFPSFASLDLWDIDFVEAEEMRADLQKKWAEVMKLGTK